MNARLAVFFLAPICLATAMGGSVTGKWVGKAKVSNAKYPVDPKYPNVTQEQRTAFAFTIKRMEEAQFRLELKPDKSFELWTRRLTGAMTSAQKGTWSQSGNQVKLKANDPKRHLSSERRLTLSADGRTLVAKEPFSFGTAVITFKRG